MPLFWKFSGRVYTWAIDGTLPLVNQKFVDALLFGEFDINTYLADKLQTPLQLSLMKLKKFLVTLISVESDIYLLQLWLI